MSKDPPFEKNIKQTLDRQRVDPQTADALRSYPLDRFGWYVDVSADDMIIAVASDDGLLHLFEME